MGIFDWLIILFLVFSIWRGWRRGLVRMILHLVGVVLVFFLIAHYFPLVRQGLMTRLQLGSALSTILGVVLIVAMIALIVQIIRMLLERAMKLMHMSFFNSSLGAIFGFLTGLLSMVVLSILIEAVPSFRRDLQDSDKHRVYAAVRVVRSELITALNIKEKIPAAADTAEAREPDKKK